MTRALQMVHEVDPKREIMDRVAPYLDNVQVLAAEVLLAIYVRPEKTAGGIYLSGGKGHTRHEDVYQGKVGLVLKVGPIAFSEDSTHRFGGVVPQVGDWVALRVGDSFQLAVGDQPCRIAEDINFKLILKDPDAVI